MPPRRLWVLVRGATDDPLLGAELAERAKKSEPPKEKADPLDMAKFGMPTKGKKKARK